VLHWSKAFVVSGKEVAGVQLWLSCGTAGTFDGDTKRKGTRGDPARLIVSMLHQGAGLLVVVALKKGSGRRKDNLLNSSICSVLTAFLNLLSLLNTAGYEATLCIFSRWAKTPGCANLNQFPLDFPNQATLVSKKRPLSVRTTPTRA